MIMHENWRRHVRRIWTGVGPPMSATGTRPVRTTRPRRRDEGPQRRALSSDLARRRLLAEIRTPDGSLPGAPASAGLRRGVPHQGVVELVLIGDRDDVGIAVAQQTLAPARLCYLDQMVREPELRVKRKSVV